MDILHLLPWCRIDKSCEVEGVLFTPLKNDDLTAIDPSVRADAASELTRIVDGTGTPITRATIFRLARKPLLAEFAQPAEVEEYVEAVDLLCFSALARRDFLGRMDRDKLEVTDAVKFGEQLEEAAAARVTIAIPSCEDTYCNADCFQPFGLPLGAPAANVTFVGTNRRDHHHVQSYPRGSTRLTVPPHVDSLLGPSSSISPDSDLLRSLLVLRQACKSGNSSKKWEDWYDGIENFNQANSDNPTVRWQTEWVLMCGAFRRVLLQDGYKARLVADAFAAAFLPADPFLSKLGGCEADLHDWLYDFHAPRHDFGHGKQVGSAYKPTQSGPWLPIGTMLVAAILFPLLVRSLLFRQGLYKLTDQDRCQFASSIQLMRRFPSQKYTPAEEVRRVWMGLMNAEWANLKASTSVTQTSSNGG